MNGLVGSYDATKAASYKCSHFKAGNKELRCVTRRTEDAFELALEAGRRSLDVVFADVSHEL